MSKRLRFAINMVIGLVAAILLRWYLAANYPLLDKLLVVVSGFVVMYFALRYIYEHME